MLSEAATAFATERRLATLTTLRPDGTLDLATADTSAISGLDGYHRVLPPVRYGYARPGQFPEPL